MVARPLNEPGLGPARSVAVATDAGLRAFMLGVYNKLALGLALAGAIAWVVGDVPQVGQLMFRTVAGQPTGYTLLGMVVVFAPLVLLMGSGFVMRQPTARGAGLLYWSIVALIGASLGVLFLIYTGGSLAMTFFITAAAFGALSLWGYTTRRNLGRLGTFLLMGLVGLIVASLVNMFVRSSALYFLVDVAGVLIFSGLIAWDTQRLKLTYDQLAADDVSLAVATNYGALSLFINFINLFQFLLMMTGQRRR
jgi:FtsH-binding integral membrane protein